VIAVVVRHRLTVGDWDAALRRIALATEHMRVCSGFVSRDTLTSAGQIVTVTIWDDERSLVGWEEFRSRLVQENALGPDIAYTSLETERFSVVSATNRHDRD
jgi:heme-degrading monooxygenase HmoA